MSEPTPLDIANAATRQAIAARQNEEYAEAERLALGALGPGWTPWMKITAIDADHRRTGNTTPVATVYKVFRGEDRLTENSVYLRRIPDGQLMTAASPELLFGELLNEKHPTRTVEARGQRVPVGRWELCWSALERYEPRTAEQLAEARGRREERALAKEALDHPLFSDQILSEGYNPPKARRPRGQMER